MYMNSVVTTRIRRVREGNSFSLSVHTRGRGYPSVWSQDTSQPLVPCSFWGVVPRSCHTSCQWGGGGVPQSCHRSCLGVLQQGGHGTGKTGNLVLTFSRQGKHREFCCNTGKVFETQGKYF